MNMHLLIVLAAVGTIVFFVLAFITAMIDVSIVSEWPYRVFKIFIGLAIIALVSTILSLLAYIPIGDVEWKNDPEPTRTEYITALVDSNQTSGRMYLMSGYVREELYYQYMTKTADGGHKYRKIIASDATIYSARSNYRVEQYRQRKTWLFIYDERTVYKVFIPDGSIISNYNIDLQ